jgi:hypothetical protein
MPDQSVTNDLLQRYPSAEVVVREILFILALDGPGALSCGIGVVDEDGNRFNAGSDEFAHTMECIQVATGEGPGPDVRGTGAALTVGELVAESWPVFGVAARLHGLLSLHCEALKDASGAFVGTITWYSKQPNAFSRSLRADLGSCARAVSIAVSVLRLSA